jgi:hypothetical protein
MKTIMMVLALTLLGGCNALEKITGQENSEDHHDPVIQEFSGIRNGPSPIILSETSYTQVRLLEVFVCTNACVQTALPAYSIPVYDSIQTGISTPYAYWNYAYPNLQVVFQNYTGSDVLQYVVWARP